MKASPDIHQGDLILQGNNVTVIEGRFDINGSIIVEENATLILRHSILNFIQEDIYQFQMIFQNPSNGNPRLIAENTTITSSTWFTVQLFHNSSGTLSETTIDYYLVLTESSTVSSVNSTIGWVVLEDHASLFISNTAIGNIDIYAHNGSPYVNAQNSTIGNLMTSPVRVNCTLTRLYPRFIDFMDYQLNTSMVIAPNGWAPDIIIRRSTINNWAFWFQQSCNATISDCTLYYLRCYYNSVAWLFNVTANQFEYFLEGEAYFSWYLNVHVTDSIGQDVPSANVTIFYPNATVADSKLADANGQSKFTLMEKMMNTTGEYPVGNYTIEAAYCANELCYSDMATVNMTGNKQIELTLEGFIIPEYPSILILPLFTIAALLVALVYRRKKHP